MRLHHGSHYNPHPDPNSSAPDQVLVISYDQLRKYVERLVKITSVDLVICDEGHRLKNAEIKTTKVPTRVTPP